MTKISATILTHNEASLIEACLESLRGVADEIIIVDSFSTDSTVDICRRFGCRVTQRRMAGFGAQRQYATSLASHSYILAVDADETLSPALRQEIISLKENGFQHRGYRMPRLNFFCGYAVKHSGWYPDYQVRLFDKRYASWNLRDLNESVIFRDNVKPARLEGDLLHYRCNTSMEYLARCMKQAEIRALSIAKENDRISTFQPALMGLRHFMATYFLNKGFLDGSIGFAISRQNYIATRHAYRMARYIINKNEQNRP